MDLLNDDCLIIIFKLLNLKDQISAALACDRFRHVLFYLWQKIYQCLSLNFDIEDITVKDFAVLIKGISITVQQMRLRGLTVQRFNVLKLHKFPNLTRFSFTQWSRSQLSDYDVLDMTKIFPKLISFSPHGTFSGMHMENWRYLQVLNLTYCAKLKFTHLETIFEELHLKSVQLNVFFLHYEWTSDRGFKNFTELESIFLNTNELAWLLKLSKFMKLKEVTIADRDAKGVLHEFLRNFNEYKSNDLIELETGISFPFFRPQINEFVNLKKLIVVSTDISVYIDICKCVTNLREIVFKCCDISTSEDLRILLIQSVPIEYISVEKCNCGFRSFILDAKDITQNRTKILHFNFFENSYTERNNPVFLRFVAVSLSIDGSSALLETTTDISTPVTFQPLRLKFL